MCMAQRTFIFIGRSGCGKGTQAHLLMNEIEQRDPEKRPICYLETGAKFREFIKGEKYSNKLAAQILEMGDRQPDFLAVWNWSDVLVNEMDADKHLIVDGMPRSYQEALVFDSAINFYNLSRPVVIYINVSRDHSRDRLVLRGRADDIKPEVIEKRLSWFDTEVNPAIEYFKHHSGYLFVEVNGEQTIEKVFADIVVRLSW